MADELPKSVKPARDAYDRAEASLHGMNDKPVFWRDEQERTLRQLADLDDRRITSKMAGKRQSFDPVARLLLQQNVDDIDEMLRRFDAQVRERAGAVWDVEGRALAAAWRAYDVETRRAELAEVDRLMGRKSPPKYDPFDPESAMRVTAAGRDHSLTYDSDSRNVIYRAAYVEWWASVIMGREPGPEPQQEWLSRGTDEYESKRVKLMELDPKLAAAQMTAMQAARQVDFHQDRARVEGESTLTPYVEKGDTGV